MSRTDRRPSIRVGRDRRGERILLSFRRARFAQGTYLVANCASDPKGHSTDAFGMFATRGMKIRRACSPDGPGPRGLVVGNSLRRRGTVKRGSTARVTLEAPAGTHFIKYWWAGEAVRVDCRYAMQIWAEVPGGQTIPIVNKRANKECPKKGRAQAAQVPRRDHDVVGATKIVQRVVCLGGGGRIPPLTARENSIRTYQAMVSVKDDVLPTASVLPGTPLTDGAWVKGDQSAHYDANDNIGVQSAEVSIGGYASRERGPAVPDRKPWHSYAVQSPCPNGPGQVVAKDFNCPRGHTAARRPRQTRQAMSPMVLSRLSHR